MKLLLLIIISAVAAGDGCPRIYFNNKQYNIEELKDGVLNIHQMVFDNGNNTLYFTFDTIDIVPASALGFLNLDTRRTGVVKGINNPKGLAIDHKRNRIYVGGSDGLYFLNNNNIPERLPVGDNIQYIFFKDVLYFINVNREAYKFDNGNVTRLSELYGVAMDKLIVDDSNYFFLQGTKLSRVRVGSEIVVSHHHIVDAIATDFNFKPYVCTKTGMYAYNKYKYALDKVSDVIDIREFTFNKNGDLIYVVADHIFKLNDKPCLRK